MMPKKSCLVSVVIPFYNRHDHLRAALASVHAQKLDDSEIIVVDDGSDCPLALQGDHGVDVVRHDQNRGAAAARNTGMRRARGRFIAFLDCDDIWQAGKLETQIDFLQTAEANVIGVFAPFAHEARPGRFFNTGAAPADWFAYFLLGCRVAPGSTLVMRREIIDSVGPQDETLRRYEDWDWLLRAARHYEFAFSTGSGAVLGATGRPALEDVLSALAHIERNWLTRLNGHQRRGLSAALALERAAAYRWHSRHGQFASSLIKAGMISPSTVAKNLAWRLL